MKHTPEWTAYNSSRDDITQVWYVLERGKRDRNDTVAMCKGPKAEERAKLLAAAPAMLAALELALDPKGADWMAVAEDAIALATGKEG